MNHLLDLDANLIVHCVLAGKTTPTQKKLVQNKEELDTSRLMQMLRWNVSESGHPGHVDVDLP